LLGGQWKVLMLGGPWNVPCLVVNGETSFSLLFTFPPNKFYLHFFFIVLRFYFTMVLNYYFTSFLPFPWPITYNHAFQCTKSSTHSSPSWFWSKIFSFLWIHGVTHYFYYKQKFLKRNNDHHLHSIYWHLHFLRWNLYYRNSTYASYTKF